MFEVKEKPRLVEKAFLLAVVLREDERENAESLLDELEELVSITFNWHKALRPMISQWF